MQRCRWPLWMLFLVLAAIAHGADSGVVSDPDGFCNVRERADRDSPVRFRVDDGAVVSIIEKVGDWYRIETADFRTGFIHQSRIKPGPAGTGRNVPRAARQYAVVSGEPGVNMRKGPAAKSPVVGTILKGQRIPILQVSENLETIGDKRAHWLETEHNGRTGWVYGAFVVLETPATGTTPSDTAGRDAGDGAPGSAELAGELRQYHNARFGYRLSVPSSLQWGGESATGDGQNFHTRDRRLEIAAFGKPRDEKQTGATLLAELAAGVDSVLHQETSASGCYLIGITGPRMVFVRYVLDRAVIAGCRITCPADESTGYQAVIDRILATLALPGAAPPATAAHESGQ